MSGSKKNKEYKLDQEPKIVIPLENFKYSNTTNTESNDTESAIGFLGRTKELVRLEDHLISGHKNNNFRGSILVAGYRGVGKTRFVNEALSRYQSNSEYEEDCKKNNVEVKINLGSEKNINSKTVLSNMVSLLMIGIQTKLIRNGCRYFLIPFIRNDFFQLIFLGIFLTFTFLICREFLRMPLDFGEINIDLFVYFFLSIFSLTIFVLLKETRSYYSKYLTPLHEIQNLQKEMYATSEKNFQLGWRDWGGIGTRAISKPLDNNQIESRLRKIIDDAAKESKFEIIFIFDELDKLSGVAAEKNDVNPDTVRELQLRKQQVDSVLGDLKNLITSSNAIYIFIAGRDMYDAYLSERGSSNSLYESLFNDHIYIPSFLTDRSNDDVYYLDSIIEAFVVSNLIPDEIAEDAIRKIKDTEDEEKSLIIDFSFLKLANYSDYKLEYECEEGEEDKLKQTAIKKIRDILECKDVDLEKVDLSFLESCDSQDVIKKFFGARKDKKYLTDLLVYLETQEKKNLIQNIYLLKTFIHYLTLHSWGNCKRLFTLFESFVRPSRKWKGKYELYFSRKDIQRLVLASHLYILFHHNLSRMLMNADDKLVVSSLSVFHYIMKYHGIGFSRGHILRMYETINVHSSPELAHIVDVIIHNVLRSHVRRIRNSFYRYRFSFLHEQEIHFITTINDGESAVFSFSLNAMDAVKQHYRNLIADSQYTNTDMQYGNVALASIHVVVGNFHFWEQSYDEAKIQYGIALDILDKESGAKDELAKIDVVVQQIEVFLKQGPVAERMGNYSSAASIYISAEEIANKCLKTLYSNGIKDQDSKWDVLRQPKWAKHFLNLKRSAIHYDQHIHLDRNTSDVSRYRNAVLSYFMENYPHAYSGFMSVTSLQREDQSNERAYFLEGNAYLKAGFSLLLNNSSNLYKQLSSKDFNRRDQDRDLDIDEKLKKILPVLVDCIGSAIEEICEFEKDKNNGKEKSKSLEGFERTIKTDLVIGTVDNRMMMGQAIGLIKKSASCFERGRLNVNAAISYLSIVTMWEALLEMFPWQRIGKIDNNPFVERMGLDKAGDDGKPSVVDKIGEIKKEIQKLHLDADNWIFSAQEKTFEFTRNNTGGAFSHFMKTALSRNIGLDISETLFAEQDTSRGIILDEEFLKDYIYQHYSVFGQSMFASVYWEEITARIVCQAANKDGTIEKEEFPEKTGSLMQGKVLPYGIRYYSTMLWLKGRVYLDKLLKFPSTEIFDKKNTENFSPKIKEIAANALINLFRSSQYVIKTHGETANMVLPPLFIIYYNMWEVLFHLVSAYKARDKDDFSFPKIVAIVRDEMDEVFRKEEIKDVTARILDLNNVTQIATEQFKIVERMWDLNASDRTSIIRNKYYLDDDYEDNMFNLDWCYCRFHAPGVWVHRLVIESEMQWLKESSNEIKW